MSDVINIEPDPQKAHSLKIVGMVSYALHTVVALGAVLPGFQASVALLLVALIIDLVKRDDAKDTWQASHFSWRIRSVVWAGVLYVVTAPLWVLLIAPGWIAWAIISIWFAYRVIRGFLSLSGNKPMPM
jgi:uncharacterized membrane protein